MDRWVDVRTLVQVVRSSRKEKKKNQPHWVSWLAQWVEWVTLGLGAVSSSPALGVEPT